jgi:hypothetical protein
MAGGPRGPKLHPMQAIDVTLRLDVAGDTFTGIASDGNGESREFSGWLGLISALESLLATDSHNNTLGGTR